MIIIAEIQKIDSILLSEYILQKGGPMSHLKLQKLLYYIEGFHLAYFDHSLIEDNFEAWLHGPVSRKVYDSLKGYSVLYTAVEYKKEEGKDEPSAVLPKLVTEDQLEAINDVIEEYGELTASQLENLTHSEAPWIEARRGYNYGNKCHELILKTTMQKAYKTQLYG